MENPAMTDNLFEGVACGTIRAREERERKARLEATASENSQGQPHAHGRGSSRESGSGGLSREQLMSRILELTGGRSRDFLEGFTDERLADYLERLLASREPRGPGARWVRRGETPAIMARESDA
ncbi:MAG: hypothetical protein DYG93_03845 [Leptolyngbya sp. PLA2]|nr:hypothetical protein [Leptolyngbya sp. PL-A2]MCQ3939941.1 hypothetical protein [cyanobacterium CYA1]